MEACTIKKSRTERLNRKNFDGVRRGKLDLDAAQVSDVQNHSIFVATWNVGGKSPPYHLNLEDWTGQFRRCLMSTLKLREAVLLSFLTSTKKMIYELLMLCSCCCCCCLNEALLLRTCCCVANVSGAWMRHCSCCVDEALLLMRESTNATKCGM